MFIKVNSKHNVSLMVKDAGGNRITDDNPIAVIYDKDNNKYFNGLFWVDSKIELSMPHVINGVYTIVFSPDIASTFEISIKSEAYNLNKFEVVKSYSDEALTYEWPLGTSYNIVHILNDDTIGNIPSATIFREYDQSYFNGFEWVTDECSFELSLLEDSVCFYGFLVDVQTKYIVTISETTGYKKGFILDVKEGGSASAPKEVGSKTLKAQDGTDTVLLSSNGSPIEGVKITCYDMETGDSITSTTSNARGEWNMLIKTGNYLFTFEKDGYMSVSLQRKVI